MKIFTVHDVKAEAYLQPFFAQAVGAAKRSFADAINDSKHQFGQHYSDYTLFELGEFDELTGKITLLDNPRSLGNGVDFQIQQ